MNLSRRIINDGLPQKATIELMNHFQQEVLKISNETHNAAKALSQSYEMLTDEQKMAFILAGGVPSLFYYQELQTQGTGTDPDSETGQLPVLC